MNKAYRRLVAINECNKNDKKRLRVKIEKIKGKYYVVNPRLDNKIIKGIEQLGTLYEMLAFNNYYITNMSILNNVSCILNNFCITGKEYDDIRWIILHLDYTLNSLSIYRVDNLETEIVKGALFGKILYSTPFLALILTNTLDLKLISDMTLRITDNTNFSFQYMRIKRIYISNLNIENVKYLDFLFSMCDKTEEILLKDFNTKNVVSFSNMFLSCTKLKKVNVEEIITDNATNFRSMFKGCSSLTKLNLNHFNVEHAYNFVDMFRNCINLEEVQIEKWVLNNEIVKDFSNMFRECVLLRNLNTAVFYDNVTKRNNRKGMFSGTIYE